MSACQVIEGTDGGRLYRQSACAHQRPSGPDHPERHRGQRSRAPINTRLDVRSRDVGVRAQQSWLRGDETPTGRPSERKGVERDQGLQGPCNPPMGACDPTPPHCPLELVWSMERSAEGLEDAEGSGVTRERCEQARCRDRLPRYVLQLVPLGRLTAATALVSSRSPASVCNTHSSLSSGALKRCVGGCSGHPCHRQAIAASLGQP